MERNLTNKIKINFPQFEMISARNKSAGTRPLLENEYQASSVDIFHGLTFPEVPTTPPLINIAKVASKLKSDTTNASADDQGYVALLDQLPSRENIQENDITVCAFLNPVT